jgi:hypothetical protein
VAVGWNDDLVKENAGREEVFNIADNEQLIGCEIHYSKDCFRGVTWLKIQICDFKHVD